MAKKKTTNAATEQQANRTEPPTTSTGEAAEPQENGGNRSPLKVLSYQIGHDAYVQASVWGREVQRKDGGTFVTYDVSLRKRYRDATTGEWKSLYSFHVSELYSVVHALISAAGTITELRAADVPF